VSSFGLYLLSEAPAFAEDASPFQGITANSLYVTLGLFLLTAPGVFVKQQMAAVAVLLSPASCMGHPSERTRAGAASTERLNPSHVLLLSFSCRFIQDKQADYQLQFHVAIAVAVAGIACL
jgi:hypothetical protein